MFDDILNRERHVMCYTHNTLVDEGYDTVSDEECRSMVQKNNETLDFLYTVVELTWDKIILRTNFKGMTHAENDR